jgi:hypothetical protein
MIPEAAAGPSPNARENGEKFLDPVVPRLAKAMLGMDRNASRVAGTSVSISI